MEKKLKTGHCPGELKGIFHLQRTGVRIKIYLKGVVYGPGGLRFLARKD
jgi:hypothetical protein